MSAAIRRVERLLAGATPTPAAVIKTTYADLHALLALAKSAGELKRRIRLARRWLRPLPNGDVVGFDDIEDLLTLRKPVRKRGGR